MADSTTGTALALTGYDGMRILRDVAKRRTSFFLDPELSDGLKALKARDGVAEGEAIRRAIADYLAKRGIRVAQADLHRAPTRRRS
jgi:hypothetical protein